METFKGFKGVKEEITARYNMYSGREKEICFRCTAIHAIAIAVAVLGAFWIMLLILLPFGYFAMQECNVVCSGNLGHCYGCIDV